MTSSDRPSVVHRRVSAPASFAGLKDIFDACSAFAKEHELPGDVRHDMYLAIDELVSNVIRHGRRQHGLRPRITLDAMLSDHTLTVLVADDAAPFDPFSQKVPDLTTPILDRELGGLGIHFVRTLMDDVRYRRQFGRNHVRLRKRWQQSM